MPLFICYATRSADNVPRRVEVEAPTQLEAVRIALGGHPGRCSVRCADAPTAGLDIFRDRAALFPSTLSGRLP